MKNKAKLIQSCITFDTQLKMVLSIRCKPIKSIAAFSCQLSFPKTFKILRVRQVSKTNWKNTFSLRFSFPLIPWYFLFFWLSFFVWFFIFITLFHHFCHCCPIFYKIRKPILYKLHGFFALATLSFFAPT